MSEPRRDHWGRYLITPPSGGKPVAHTRVTTVAEVLDDRFFIEKWQQRMVAHGLSKREDLQALAASTSLDEKKALNKICSQAIEAAGGSDRSNKGSAVHKFTERLDRGEKLAVPAPWDQDVQAYQRVLHEHGIEIVPEWVEVIAVCDALPEPVAGTADRIVRWDDDLLIADLKTGRDLHFSWRAIAIQLGIYSRAKTLYNPETDTHSPMPDVRKDKALVWHLPAGEGICTPYLVDIAAGWEAAQHALWTRGWRKREDLAEVVDLSTPLELAA